MDHPPEVKRLVGTGDAMEFGSAVHDAVLLPDRFAADYTSLPFRDGREKGAQDWIESQPAGRVILRTDAIIKIVSMRDAIMSQPLAAKLIKSATYKELSTFWTDKITGILCKMRADVVIAGGRSAIILDLKTTANPNPTAFEFSASDYGYHRQAAMYLDGLSAAGIPADVFGFIVVGKEPPHIVAVSPMAPAAIEVGREENRQLLSIYAECEKSGEWPAYDDDMQTINIPARYRRLNLTETP
jgi:hypothetical protein